MSHVHEAANGGGLLPQLYKLKVGVLAMTVVARFHPNSLCSVNHLTDNTKVPARLIRLPIRVTFVQFANRISPRFIFTSLGHKYETGVVGIVALGALNHRNGRLVQSGHRGRKGLLASLATVADLLRPQELSVPTGLPESRVALTMW